MTVSAPPSPRLLVVVWRFPVFSETFVLDHVRGMAARGWSVTLCCASVDERLVRAEPALVEQLAALRPLGPKVASPTWARRATSLVRAGQVRAVRSRLARHAALMAGPLAAVVDDCRPDLIHAHFAPNAAAAGLAVRWAADGPPIPVVADLHGHDLTSDPQREGWAAARRLLDGQHLVVHSRFAAGLAQRGLGIEPHLVAYGASPLFQAPVRPGRWSRPLPLLFVGRLTEGKGADVALAALAQLAQRRPELDPHLVLVGDGPERAALTAEAERLGVGGRCRFAGALSERAVAEAMAAHEILLMPSRTTADGWVEAFGKVALEGVASGMAVVASRSGGLPEAVSHAGTLVPPADARAVTEAVEHLVDASSPAYEAARGHGSYRSSEEAWDSYDRLSREVAGLPATR